MGGYSESALPARGPPRALCDSDNESDSSSGGPLRLRALQMPVASPGAPAAGVVSGLRGSARIKPGRAELSLN